MTSESEFPPSFLSPWTARLRTSAASLARDFPNYHVDNPECLVTSSEPRALHFGTGHSVFDRAIRPAILGARSEIYFVVCYWAAGPTLDSLRDAILALAASRTQQMRKSATGSAGATETRLPTLTISIGFSSRGLFQKLFHTSSRDGYAYPPSRWHKLGLPDEETLTAAGIEMRVKSLFFTPVSVLHSKYVVVDRERAWVVSWNVSWERWLEGAVELEGGVVGKLAEFHEQVWGGGHREAASVRKGQEREQPIDVPAADHGRPEIDAREAIVHAGEDDESASLSVVLSPPPRPVPTIFLPSSHHRNPRFAFFPFLARSDPPVTPLNAALLTLFGSARRKIDIVTPNVTSRPVIDSVLGALERGVDVSIRTSRSMMLVEQLVTAGTTTAWCLRRLIKRYEEGLLRHADADVESRRPRPGRLQIFYHKPSEARKRLDDEPVLSHLKLTTVDDEYVLLGSGNMDRASWWTSQEIGVLFHVPGLDDRWRMWERVWERRCEAVYVSGGISDAEDTVASKYFGK